MTFLYYLFLTLFLFLAFLLCVVILMQESKSGGLGASFGGDSSDSLLGTAAPEILKKVTAWMLVLFLSGCVILSVWTGAMGRVKAKREVTTEIIEQ